MENRLDCCESNIHDLQKRVGFIENEHEKQKADLNNIKDSVVSKEELAVRVVEITSYCITCLKERRKAMS